MLEDEQVVTSGQFLLDSESNAREAIKKMLEAKQQLSGDVDEQRRKGEQMNHEGHEHQMSHDHTKKIDVKNTIYTCPMHPEFTTDDPDQRCPICGMKLIKKKDVKKSLDLYTCPMHPEFVTDDPNGRCSICEMKLVKKN